MTLEELNTIRYVLVKTSLLTNAIDVRALAIVDREIRLKTMDPRIYEDKDKCIKTSG